jgi:arylsulfatase A-like enzyme
MTEPRRKNILLITFDQWRADCLSAVGHPCLKTPHLDALAADGVLFRRHYTQASPCGPARASLFTGLYLHNHRSLRNGTPLDDRHANLARELRGGGYDPVLFGYTDTSLDPRGLPAGDPRLATFEGVLPGFRAMVRLDETFGPWIDWLARKGYDVPRSPAPGKDMFLPLRRGAEDDGAGPSFAPTSYRAEHSETAFLTDAALDFVADQGEDPWCVHLSYYRPHPPYVAPAPYNALYSADSVPAPNCRPQRSTEGAQHPWLKQHLDRLWSGAMPVQEPRPMAALDERGVRQIRATYYGTISQLDDSLGRVVAALKAGGSYDQTLIVVTADHADQLGDHWLFGKDGYFESAFHIPLIVRDPEAPSATRGRVVDEFTETIDVMPTILEWAGRPVPHACDGHSLRPWLYGETPADWRREVHWEYDFRDMREPAAEVALGLSPDSCHLAVIRDRRYKYVHFAALPPLLFDLERDPHEFENRAVDPAYQALVLAYAQKLLSWRMLSENRALSHLHLGPGGAFERRGPWPSSAVS